MISRFKQISAAIVLCAGIVTAAQAAPAPEVTYDRVQAIFGQNLEEQGTLGHMLLLAVGMDNTTPDSPYANERIGIPFIVDAGPNYWVQRLKAGERELEVLVNNALLLMFTTEKIPQKQAVAHKLLEVAAEQGYWPADYYIADYNLTNRLAMGEQKPLTVLRPLQENVPLKALAQDTMERLNRCAALGFAPCQYRIGFWLSSQSQTLADGVGVLRQAIATTLADTRYNGMHDAAMLRAAQIIIANGKAAGMSEEQIAKTSEFIGAMKRELLDGVQELLP